MKNIHLMLQGKGGCGKSYIASLLAQYLRDKGELHLADTDVSNQTFAKYKDLGATYINTSKNGIVNMELFDPIIKMMALQDTNFLIDNGSSTFLPLLKYLSENDVYEVMHENNKKIFVHCPLAGGGAADETYSWLATLIETIGENAQVVVWENEFWGPVLYGERSVTESKLYKESLKSGKIAGLINVKKQESDYNISAVNKLTTLSMTLRDAESSPGFDFLIINRIKKIHKEIYSQLDKINWN